MSDPQTAVTGMIVGGPCARRVRRGEPLQSVNAIAAMRQIHHLINEADQKEGDQARSLQG